MKENKKSPCDYDRRIGERIKARRIAARLSQEELGKELHLTFQQIQKYEKGMNRVSAARLVEIAKILGAPVVSFLDPEDGTIEPPDPSILRLIDDYKGLPGHVQSAVRELCATLKGAA